MLNSAAYTAISKFNPLFNKSTVFSFIYHCPLNSNFFTKLIQNDSDPLSMLSIQDMINKLQRNPLMSIKFVALNIWQNSIWLLTLIFFWEKMRINR